MKMPNQNDIGFLLTHYTSKLASISDCARVDVERLICFILNVTPSYLYTWPEKTLTYEQYKQLNQLIQQRLNGKPIAYIIGEQDFWSLTLKVDQSTLIPRADTECLIEDILSHHPKTLNIDVLDLGTGSGAIALALASERPNWHITATEISDEALYIAKENAKTNNINNVNFIKSDWYENIQGQFDLIISNPPYIAQNDPHLCQYVKIFEPSSAIIANNNGLADIEHIIIHARRHLNKNGQLILEHGFQQAQRVADIFAQNHFSDIEHISDLAGHLRATKATLV